MGDIMAPHQGADGLRIDAGVLLAAWVDALLFGMVSPINVFLLTDHFLSGAKYAVQAIPLVSTLTLNQHNYLLHLWKHVLHEASAEKLPELVRPSTSSLE